MGNVVWATPEDDGQQRVIPSGDSVEQAIETIDAPGGQFTELITDTSLYFTRVDYGQ